LCLTCFTPYGPRHIGRAFGASVVVGAADFSGQDRSYSCNREEPTQLQEQNWNNCRRSTAQPKRLKLLITPRCGSYRSVCQRSQAVSSKAPGGDRRARNSRYIGSQPLPTLLHCQLADDSGQIQSANSAIAAVSQCSLPGGLCAIACRLNNSPANQ